MNTSAHKVDSYKSGQDDTAKMDKMVFSERSERFILENITEIMSYVYNNVNISAG